MVLQIIGSAILDYVPSGYYIPLIIGTTSIFTLTAWSAGKRTNRERDLHGRTVLLTVSNNLLLGWQTRRWTDASAREHQVPSE